MVGAALVGAWLAVAIAAPVPATYYYGAQWHQTLAPPGTPNHILGTDDLGRDVYSRHSPGHARLSAGGHLWHRAVYRGKIRLPVGKRVVGTVDLVLSALNWISHGAFPSSYWPWCYCAIIGPGLTSVLLSSWTARASTRGWSVRKCCHSARGNSSWSAGANGRQDQPDCRSSSGAERPARHIGHLFHDGG